MMKILIKNGNVYENLHFIKKDILIVDDLISEISGKIKVDADRVIDAKGKYVFPGFIDLHCHLRDPGQTHKEDIVSGTMAAAKGGYTTICAMPNTDPVIDNIATVEYIRRKSHDLGYAKVLVIGAMTKKAEGKEISEMATMQKGGIIAVSDDGNCVQNAKLMQNCLMYAANFNIPVIIHAEDYNLAGKGQINAGKMATKLGLSGIPGLAEEIIISRDIMLAEATKARLHVAHISTAKSIELVRQAKLRGLPITCEVTPHHLTLTEEATEKFDTNTKVKPPLRSNNDRMALIDALNAGIIDFIATDHAPHSDFEKELEFDYAPYGINGFETAFASLYTELIKPGLVSLERIIEALTIAPAQFLSLPIGKLEVGKQADISIANLDASIDINSESMLSKSKNTPYIGKTLQGSIETTICGGRFTWEI
jgi:dihydroorotase